MSPAVAPLTLSICTPTHDGRSRTLAHGLEVLLDQITPALRPQVEVCVSDNASRDGTAEVVQSLAATAAVPIHYRRNEVDLGPGANILRSVEMASGRYCWLMSSDDALADGALARVLELLEEHPDLAGASVGCETFDRRFERSFGAPPPGYLPPGDRPRVIEGLGPIVAALGPWFIGMSLHIVRRSAWQAALRGHPDPRLLGGLLPHVAPLVGAASTSGRWLWCPEPLVRWRSTITPPGRLGAEGYLAGVLDDLARSLGTRLDPDDPSYRSALARFARWHVSPVGLRALAVSPGHTLRARVLLGRVMFRRLYWLPAFWRSMLPSLLLPAPAVRVLQLTTPRTRARRLASAARLAVARARAADRT